MIVVDASVAAHWCDPSPFTPAANRLLRGHGPVVAPDLVVAEVVNVLAKTARAEPARAPALRDGLNELTRWIDELVASANLHRRALALAFDLRHPAYDMFYLALAEARDAPLFTADARLIARLEGTPHARRLRRLGD